MMPHLFTLLVFGCLMASAAFAQVGQRAVKTTADLLIQPPETFSERAAGDPNFTSIVTTMGDATVGDVGTRTWLWVPTATNAASSTVLVYPPYPVGRWIAIGAVGSGGAGAAGTPTTFNTFSALVGATPDTARPLARVLGGSALNDSNGGDYVWDSASAAATNVAPAGPIAIPYGAATGRYVRLVQGNAVLDDAQLQGTTTISKAPFTGGATEPATIRELDIKSASVAENLAALKNAPVEATRLRLGIVRVNTITSSISDNAIGFWLWDPASSATESPVVQKSSTIPTSDPGRWLKFF